MKYYIVHGKYLIPFGELTQLGDLVQEHRAYVQQEYESGKYLLSGPEVPAESGVVIARAESRAELDALMAAEPFVREGKVQITRVVEFQPARSQPYLGDWVGA